MDRSTQGESATIYQFPAGGRRGKANRESIKTAAADARRTRLPTAEIGSGWYHDAAIAEAEQVNWRQPR